MSHIFISHAIATARQTIAVLSLQTVNSPWVCVEIDYALGVEQQRKEDSYRVISLLRPGVKPAALGNWFDQEPVAMPIELGPGGLDEALPAILAALGERRPADRVSAGRPVPAPVDELILELRDPTMATRDGQRRARATATLAYRPATRGEFRLKSVAKGLKPRGRPAPTGPRPRRSQMPDRYGGPARRPVRRDFPGLPGQGRQSLVA